MTHLAHAIEVATKAHDGQTDKTGLPYVEHCRRVAKAVDALDEKIVAWLHDVVEKGDGWSLERLREVGFSPAIVSAVDALTKREGEEDGAFVRRAASNPIARPVKLADLADNRRQAAVMGMSPARYDEGLTILAKEVCEGKNDGGS